MAISNANANTLNRSNRASKNVLLGTLIQTAQNDIDALQGVAVASGSVAATSADASNAKVAITTGLTAVNGFIAQVRRSGSAMPFMKMTAGSVAGTIEIFKDPTYTGGSSIAAADVVTWIAF